MVKKAYAYIFEGRWGNAILSQKPSVTHYSLLYYPPEQALPGDAGLEVSQVPSTAATKCYR